MKRLFVGFFLLLISIPWGCQLTFFESAPTEAPIETPKKNKNEQIENLLENAQQALRQDHLLYPKETSAYAYLALALELNPDDENAKRGLEQVVERYIELAIQAIGRRQLNRAKSMLDRAKLVDKNHPSILPTENQLKLVVNSDLSTLKLNGPKIDDAARNSISKFGSLAKRRDCRFIIYAANDQQGRSIYQLLKNDQAELKIKAQIKLRLPMQIERQCVKP